MAAGPAAEDEQAEAAGAELPAAEVKSENVEGGEDKQQEAEQQLENGEDSQPAPPRPPAASFRAPGAFAGVLDSPVLLPMLPVRRSGEGQALCRLLLSSSVTQRYLAACSKWSHPLLPPYWRHTLRCL